VPARKQYLGTIFRVIENRIVSAPWISEKERTADIPYLADKLRTELQPRGRATILVIVPLHPSVPFVEAIQQMVGHVDDLKELPAFTFDGMVLKRGYILTSQPRAQTSPPTAVSAT
jgi:hypothetical protein